MSDKPLEPVWPSEELAQRMVADAVADDQVAADVGCHVLALLQRVRDLEAAYSRTSELARDLFERLDSDYRNDHIGKSAIMPLWLRGCKEFGIDPTCYREKA